MAEKQFNLNYQVPIRCFANQDDFMIEGIAINSTVTANNHKFLPEELKSSAKTLNGVPLLVDHRNEVDAIKGRVLEGDFNEIEKNIKFKAIIKDSAVQSMIKDGRLDSVSVGAAVKDIEESDDGFLIPRGIVFKELSLVAVPADEGATFNVALREAYQTRMNEPKLEISNSSNDDIKLKGGTEMTEQTTETNFEEISKEVSEVKETLKAQSELMASMMAKIEEMTKVKEADADESKPEEPKALEEPKEEPKEAKEEVEKEPESEESEEDAEEEEVSESYKVVNGYNHFTVVRTKY